MNRPPPVIRWLALAALADWLIARTLTRSAIFMPKSSPVIAVYQALTMAGQLAITLTALLTFVAASWIAWRGWRTRRAFGPLVIWPSLLAFSLLFVVMPPAGFWAVGYHLLVIAAVAMIGSQAWGTLPEMKERVAWSFPALALLAGELYQGSHALYAAWRWAGPPPFAAAIFSLGELFAVLSPIGVWWAAARGRVTPWQVWVWAALPALAFSAMHRVNPAMTGILSIWSTGLTLILPWPLYAVSLWLAGVTVVVSLRAGGAKCAGWAVLLLAAGGYAPQLSTHAFLSLIALWLLASSETEPAVSHSMISQGALNPHELAARNLTGRP